MDESGDRSRNMLSPQLCGRPTGRRPLETGVGGANERPLPHPSPTKGKEQAAATHSNSRARPTWIGSHAVSRMRVVTAPYHLVRRVPHEHVKIELAAAIAWTPHGGLVLAMF